MGMTFNHLYDKYVWSKQLLESYKSVNLPYARVTNRDDLDLFQCSR